MNISDFSLEELQVMHLDMLSYINRTTILKESPSHKALREKLEKMIDEYCEHNWRKGVHLFNDIYCTKCDKHFPVSNEE